MTLIQSHAVIVQLLYYLKNDVRSVCKYWNHTKSIQVHTLKGQNITDEAIEKFAHLFPNVTDINLDCNCKITNNIIQHLSSYSNLCNISLANTSITSTGIIQIGVCINVQSINLENCTIDCWDGKCFKSLANCPKLTSINISKTSINDQMMFNLVDSCPKLTCINLKNCYNITQYNLL